MALRTAWSPRVTATNRKEGLDTASCAIDGSEKSKRIGPRGRKHDFNEKPLPCTWPVIGCAVSCLRWPFSTSVVPIPLNLLTLLSQHKEFTFGDSKVFIGPESNHWQPLSLTDSHLVDLIDMTLACEDANSKLVKVVTVTDVDAEDHVGSSLFHIWELTFGP